MIRETSKEFNARQKNTIIMLNKEVLDLNRKLKKSNGALLKIRGLVTFAVEDLGVKDA